MLISFLKHICACIQLALSSEGNGLKGSGRRIAFWKMKSLEGVCSESVTEWRKLQRSDSDFQACQRLPALQRAAAGLHLQPSWLQFDLQIPALCSQVHLCTDHIDDRSDLVSKPHPL